MLTNPRMHGDSGSYAHIDRAGRAELSDRTHHRRCRTGLFAQPWSFLTEEKHRAFRQLRRFDGHRSGNNVDTDDLQPVLHGPAKQVIDRGVMVHMHVLVGHHRSSAIPSLLADDVHTFGIESVRGSNDGADIQIVLPVLDRNMKRVAASVEVSNDRFVRPIPITIADIAAITVFEEFGVESPIVWPWQGMRTNPDLAIFTFDELITVVRGAH